MPNLKKAFSFAIALTLRYLCHDGGVMGFKNKNTAAVFQFKQFCVRQTASSMKVGTDGVLLGAWCDVANASRILDVGTGTGLIALMVAQRNPHAEIDGIEIDRLAADEASYNFKESAWQNRLHAFCCDFRNFDSGKKYDRIVSNPPFFTNGETAPDQRRAMARHSNALPFEDLFKRVSGMLASNGSFSIIGSSEAKAGIEFHAGENNFWMKRRVAVLSNANKPIKRYLWEFVLYPVSSEESQIVIYTSDGIYTEEYIRLTGDFYLNKN